ncbi:glutamate--tRNA ligase, partial [Candidatus Peregrinibacteria bacterium RIFOXYB2_FULL_32_7]
MIKTRFAPSPTGYLHVGSLRTALYSYLFARKNNGKFILRIEDTDQERFVEGAMESLIRILKVMGLEYDEGVIGSRKLEVGSLEFEEKGNYGPYIQSKRSEIYKEYADKLLKSGHAYRCFCSKERLDAMRENQKARKLATMYDQKCAYLSEEEVQKNLDQNLPFVIRLKISHDETIGFEDMIRGKVEFKGYTIDDQVLMKSDGLPTYHLANVVDDHLMEITHVIRGEEWLPSTPKHVALYKAFGWEKPIFAHLPLLLNPDKTKLSKRQGDVAVEDYLKKGYIKEALINFVALLGWNPGTEQEIFSMQELIQAFDFSKVQKAGAVFDHEKLDWMNGKYLREMPFANLAKEIYKVLKEEDWFDLEENDEYFKKVLRLNCERMKKFSEAKDLMKFFFIDKFDYDKNLFLHEKMNVDANMARKTLTVVLKTLENLPDKNFESEEEIKLVLMKVINDLGVKNGQVLWPLRVALTNEKFSPG